MHNNIYNSNTCGYKNNCEYKKIRIRRKALTIYKAVLQKIHKAYSTIIVENLQIVSDTISLDIASYNKGNENTAKDRSKQIRRDVTRRVPRWHVEQ